MNRKSTMLVLYIVLPAVVAVVLLQLWLGYSNYRETKALVLGDIRAALAESVEHYYLEEAKEIFVTVVDRMPTRSFKDFSEAIELDSLLEKTTDSISVVEHHQTRKLPIRSYYVVKGKKSADSLLQANNTGNKITFSLKKDTLDIESINRIFSGKLQAQGVALDYNLLFYLHNKPLQVWTNIGQGTYSDTISMQSVYFPDGGRLKAVLKNPAKLVFQKSIKGIVLALLLALLVIACLFVLLKIIRFQRQNEAIKNDFIGNIAHELKTPIATVWAALEAMADVNRSADPDKARNYLKTAREHLSKLDGLADKILDTAAMEHQRLNLRLKLEDLTYMLHNLVLKYQEIYPHKTFRFEGSGKKLFSEIDIFYFEPAVGNIIDNAAKYGGNYIDIQIAAEKKGLSILVSDNGEGIAPAHAQKIFNKFYRVPQGDVHDVKGFGLGLYFSKNIIESHGASLNLSKLKPATFKIFIPDAS